jgi:hypothetical protein
MFPHNVLNAEVTPQFLLKGSLKERFKDVNAKFETLCWLWNAMATNEEALKKEEEARLRAEVAQKLQTVVTLLKSDDWST